MIFLPTDKFGVGPTAVALKQTNGWTIGGLVNQIWSVAGNDDRGDVSQMFVQPFVVYNWKRGAGLGGNFEWTQNRKAETTTLWFNSILSGLTSVGTQKGATDVGSRFNLAEPDGALADWGGALSSFFCFQSREHGRSDG